MTHGLDTDKQVFFYEQEFYVLSNFSAFRVKWLSFDFDTTEHAYQFSKFWEAGSVNQRIILNAIRHAQSAHEAFKIAQDHTSCIHPSWKDRRVDVMRGILRSKVARHEYVQRKLLETGDRELIENSWRDSFWGWGPNKDGQNQLGKLWMEIRDELANPVS